MTPESNHISLETMQSLCEGLLPDIEQCFVEDHLDECDDCRGVFRRMDELLYGGFSAETHAKAIRREAWATDPLVAALRRAASAVGREVAVTLQRWLDTASALWGSDDVPFFGTTGAVAVAGSEEPEPVKVAMERSQERCRVEITELRRDIEVSIAGGPRPAAALLFDPESDDPPVVTVFETANGVHTARFDGITHGQYLLALSPF